MSLLYLYSICNIYRTGTKNKKEGRLWYREGMYVGFVGHLFLSLLKSIIVPLIVPSIITAIGNFK
jgi:L-cystine uptake protein TcyP (sodium:dicarboxylate symporter family)